MKDRNVPGGYYTVQVDMGINSCKVPYVVFAGSDYEAARLVREQTGYMAFEGDVEGPYCEV